MESIQQYVNHLLDFVIYAVGAVLAFSFIKMLLNRRNRDSEMSDEPRPFRAQINETRQQQNDSEKVVNFDKRLDFILDYEFPTVVINRFSEHHPKEDLESAKSALKLFFVTALYKQDRTGRMDVEMTDESADHLWHIFLLDTKAYVGFCENAFGGMLHHIPYEEQKTLEGHHKKSEQAIKDMYSYLRSYRPQSHTRLAAYINGRKSSHPTQSYQTNRGDDSVCCGMGVFDIWFWWMILSDNSSASSSSASESWCTGQSSVDPSSSSNPDSWSRDIGATGTGHSEPAQTHHSNCRSSCQSDSNHTTTSSCSSSSSCGGGGD